MAQYVRPIRGTVGRTDQGVDISAPPGTPVVAIADEQEIGILPNWFKGQPLVWFRILGTNTYNYVAEQITNLRPIGTKFKQGQEVATVAPSGTGTESGWATATGMTLAKATTGYTEGQVTPAGLSYRQQVIDAGSSVGTAISSTIDIASMWVQAGGNPAVANTMAAIVLAESGGRIDAKGGPNSDGTYDLGLFQINSSHTQFNQQKLLSDPYYNTRAAVQVYNQQGLTAWSTYNSGAFRKFLPGAAKATITYGGPNGGRTRPGSSGSGGTWGGGSADITTVLSTYESQYDKPGQPWGGGVIGGDLGTNGGLFGTGIPTPGDVWSAITGAITAPIDAFKFLIWLFNPVHILRVVELIFGSLIIAGSLWTIRPKSPSLASTGAGIARVTRAAVNATPAGREIRMARGRVEGHREGQVEHARLKARRAERQRLSNP